jgi:hypothetical protein
VLVEGLIQDIRFGMRILQDDARFDDPTGGLFVVRLALKAGTCHYWNGHDGNLTVHLWDGYVPGAQLHAGQTTIVGP